MDNYTAIDLVDTHDIGYLRHSRFFKNVVKANRYPKKHLKNSIESSYQKELLMGIYNSNHVVFNN